jgi:hypothetical protein
MTEKEIYTKLCEQQPTVPLFSRPWWLDCVCGGTGRWDVMLARRGGEITAAMPYYMPCSGIITMPPYTKTMGIWFNPKFTFEVYLKELYRKQAICEEFIKRLPAGNYFMQNFHYSFTDWLPFHWHGFRQTTRYTYILPDIKDTGYLWNNCLHTERRKDIINAADKFHLEVRTGIPVSHFLKINGETYLRQGLKPYCNDVLKRLIDTSVERGQGVIYGAYDRENHLHAADFIAFQESCACCIAGTSAHEYRNSGGHALTLWQAVCDFSGRSVSIDFCGSMMRGIAGFFREFGAIQTPYFVIEKGNMDILKRIRMKISRITGV